MSKDAPLKSSYELALERLRARDREQGVDESRPLTAEQKETIAELRSRARAKLAEIEILHRKERAAVLADPDKLAELEEHYRVDRSRIESSLESSIGRVRRGEAPGDES